MPGFALCSGGGFKKCTGGGFTKCSDCPGCECTLTSCGGSAFNGSDGGDYTLLKAGSANATTPATFGQRKRCCRIFAWDCAYWQSVSGTPTYIVNEACLTVVRTSSQKAGLKSAYTGPFYSDGPGSGTELSAPPYWWQTCGSTGVGGWAIGASWWRPTTANLQTVYSILAADVGAGMPAASQTHTLLLLVQFARWDINGARGVATTEAESTVRLAAAHVTCRSVTG